MENKLTVPEYWEKHLTEKIKEIRAAKAAAGDDAVLTAIVTDFHGRENEKHSPALLYKIINDCDIPFFFQAGDIVSGCGIISPEELTEEIKKYGGLFLPFGSKCLFAEGNHDRAYSTFAPPAYYVENLDKKTFDDIYFSQVKSNPEVVYGKDGYYYADDYKTKTRYIVLNSHVVPSAEKDENGYAKYNCMKIYGFMQEQVDWLVNVALNIPASGWNVILCSHSSPNVMNFETEKPLSYNYNLVIGILNAFKNGKSFEGSSEYGNPLFNVKVKADFSAKCGNVLAWLGGHVHRDEIFVNGGIVCMDTVCDAAFCNASPKNGKRGTVNEQAFDVLVFDTKKRTAEVIRIGAGENRRFIF